MRSLLAAEMERVDRIASCLVEGLDRVERDVNKKPRRDICYTRDELRTVRSHVESLRRRACPRCHRAGNILGERCSICAGSGSVTRDVLLATLEADDA